VPVKTGKFTKTLLGWKSGHTYKAPTRRISNIEFISLLAIAVIPKMGFLMSVFTNRL
jgi:hypothetical protein